MNISEIIQNLPYTDPFLFVDGLLYIDENGVEGHYTFPASSGFYQGHFKNNPVTPGVILTECCAQIGLVCLGLYLLGEDDTSQFKIGMSGSEMEFFVPVYPGEKVEVVSEKIYYRFHKLKCRVKMYNTENQLICKGILAGMIKNAPNG